MGKSDGTSMDDTTSHDPTKREEGQLSDYNYALLLRWELWLVVIAVIFGLIYFGWFSG